MELLNELIHSKHIFFKFMKEKYPLFENSNIFLRDLQYAIKYFLEKKNIKIRYTELEYLSQEFISHLEKENIIKKVTSNAWKVNFLPNNNVNLSDN